MMKSNFLNLPSSASGDARRHVPFRSIINKQFAFVFAVIFFSLHCALVPVSALAAPEIQPIYDTTVTQLYELVNTRMTSTQEDVFNLLLGTYAAGYAGFGQYHLRYIHADNASVREWLINSGVDIYNTLVDFGVFSVNQLNTIQPVINTALACAEKALTYNPSDAMTDFLDDIDNSSNYFVSFTPEIQLGLNQFFALNGGLFEWQVTNGDWDFPQFSWDTWPMQGLEQTTYNQYLSALTTPRILLNTVTPNVYFNCVCEIPENFSYKIVVDPNGYIQGVPRVFVFTSPSSIDHYDMVYSIHNSSYNADPRQITNDMETVANTYSFNLSDYNSLVDVANYFCQNIKQYFYFYANRNHPKFCFNYAEYLEGIYVREVGGVETPLENVSDLGFEENNLQYVLAPIENILLDIKGLLSDLVDTNSLKEPVLDNIYDYNNQPVPESALQKVSVEVNLPDSGIDIPNNLFAPLTREGGYISYLWYMTKPLVQYTSDLVQTLVFPDDTGEGFDVTGPGAIVFGVISLGLIGGLVVKCLL